MGNQPASLDVFLGAGIRNRLVIGRCGECSAKSGAACEVFKKSLRRGDLRGGNSIDQFVQCFPYYGRPFPSSSFEPGSSESTLLGLNHA
jgi:hypothetical protein